MLPLIVSFYTNDWEYPIHAARLKRADVVCFHGQPRPWDVVLPAKLL